MWTDLPAGDNRACFGEVDEFAAPPRQTTTVGAGASKTVTGNYLP